MWIDSKDPVIGGEEAIAWWQGHGQDPRRRMLLFSDGLDVAAIERLHAHFAGRARVAFGWGTLLTNDFRGYLPRGGSSLDPISLVCKVVEAGGRPVVKLSDNPAKAAGPAAEIERYLRVFGQAGAAEHAVLV
jgi:nicotinate phosphoribosyltransferase